MLNGSAKKLWYFLFNYFNTLLSKNTETGEGPIQSKLKGSDSYKV